MGDFKTLSIDIGSTLGYCYGKNGVVMDSGEVTLSAGAAGKTHPGHRLLRFQKWLNNYTDVNEILFEDAGFVSSTPQIVLYGKLLGVLDVFSLVHNIRMSSLKPSQIKKDFTGMGNAKKDIVCDVARRLGWKNGVDGTMNNNNEADAIALYWVICTRRGVEPTFYEEKKFELDFNKLGE